MYKYVQPKKFIFNNQNQTKIMQKINIMLVTSTPLNSYNNFYLIKTHNLIKPFFYFNRFWSSGLLSKIVFLIEETFQKKFISQRNARKEWSLWQYGLHLNYFKSHIMLIKPWSLRTRRSISIIFQKTTYIIIQLRNIPYCSNRRRIKRWLKKKYTTQSWR